jgi:RNA polymerase sigma factor (sigma-70 family)
LMADDLYEDEVFEHVVESEDDGVAAEELQLDSRKIQRALQDLEDDFFRAGSEVTREEADRAAARHRLSIVEMSTLIRLAEEANLIERARDAFVRLDTPQELFARSHESVDLIQTYINDVRRFPLLDAKGEAELARAIEAGVRAELALSAGSIDDSRRVELQELVDRGSSARDRFIASNLRLVFAHAKARRNQGLDFLDLLQEGTLGIIRAVDKFDYRLGYKFSTYATWWVRQSIDRALADKGRVIRLPVHIVERLRKIKRVESKLSLELGREPTVTEVASVTGFDPADVAFLRDAGRDVLSLDAPLATDPDGLSLADLLPAEDQDVVEAVLQSSDHDELDELLSTLTYRERRVIELRFGLDGKAPRTLDEVGKTFNVTRERIRQIQDQSLKKMKSMALARGMFDWGVAA